MSMCGASRARRLWVRAVSARLGASMDVNKLMIRRRLRRRRRIRKRVLGTRERPRLSVFRSHKNIYAQLIDDMAGTTICQASTRDKKLRESVGYGGSVGAAGKIGAELATQAKEHGVEQVVFDRNGYKFHGRVKSLADAARKAGLKF